MHLYRSASGVVVQAPAKLNLFLEVLGKRADGYHEIEALVTPVDLYDTLYFRDGGGRQVTFTCQKGYSAWGAGQGWLEGLPEGPDNLAVRAVELLGREAGRGLGGHIHLIKRIPTAAGLGGGSSDAAAALWAANTVWGLGRSQEELAKLGAQLGADVPLFFAHGPAVCRGRGDRVEAVGQLGALWFVVVRPPVGLSTAAAYQACRPPAEPRSVQPLLEALRQGNLGVAGRLLLNRLEPAAESLSPWVRRLRQELARSDCLGHQLTGSGSCYFGLCRHARHARRVAQRLQAKGVGIALTVRACR
ncbi:MAG: 4-(cytidine 5'-diphospho)-2-C-methyl-D-erythritol kinase [Thermoguttaceae bacterium]